MTPWISFQRIRVYHAITGNRLRLLFPITLTVPPPTDYSGVMSIKKNVPWHILAPRAVACDNLHLRASAHLWHVSAFLCTREFFGISWYIKKPHSQ